MYQREFDIFNKIVDGFYVENTWTKYFNKHCVFNLPINEYMACHKGQIPIWVETSFERGVKNNNRRFLVAKNPGVAIAEREDFDTENGRITVIRYNHIGFTRKSIELFIPLNVDEYIYREETSFISGKWKMTEYGEIEKMEVERYINQWL